MIKKPPVVIDNQYGLLTVMSLAPSQPQSNKKYVDMAWHCLCECGGKKIVTENSLRHGLVKSCGCLRKNARSKMTPGQSKSYAAWAMMKRNCSNPNGPRYASVGAIGITYPPAWGRFEGFYKDMGDGPEGTFFTRADLTLNFSKENCLWSNERPTPRKEQPKNWILPFRVDEKSILDDVGRQLIRLDTELTEKIAEKIVRALNANEN